MKKTMIKIVPLLLVLLGSALAAGEKQQKNICYKPGETIAADVSVVDAGGGELRLLDLVEPDTKLIYLLIFGGPGLSGNPGDGPFWCEDSFNGMPLSTYMYLKYRDKGVRFVPVVTPPVYHEQYYGIDEGTFLRQPDSSQVYQDYFFRFVDKSEELKAGKIIPFPELYFDPRFKLLFNFKKMSDLTAYAGGNEPWLGRFKPCGDDQSYSTPVIWLLSPQGKVLSEPFFGNRYSDSKQIIRFTVRDVEQAVRTILENDENKAER